MTRFTMSFIPAPGMIHISLLRPASLIAFSAPRRHVVIARPDAVNLRELRQIALHHSKRLLTAPHSGLGSENIDIRMHFKHCHCGFISVRIDGRWDSAQNHNPALSLHPVDDVFRTLSPKCLVVAFEKNVGDRRIESAIHAHHENATLRGFLDHRTNGRGFRRENHQPIDLFGHHVFNVAGLLSGLSGCGIDPLHIGIFGHLGICPVSDAGGPAMIGGRNRYANLQRLCRGALFSRAAKGEQYRDYQCDPK